MVNKFRILVFDKITSTFTSLFLLLVVLLTLLFYYPSYYPYLLSFIFSDVFLIIFIYFFFLKESVHRFSLKYYCQIWIYDDKNKKTIQKMTEYKNEAQKSILTITPQKQKSEFLKKLSTDKTIEESERKNYEKAYNLLKKMKNHEDYENEYYVVFLKDLVLLAPMFFLAETNRLCGMAMERIFITVPELCDFDVNSIIATHPQTGKTLEQGFLIKDLSIAIYYAKQQLRESVRIEAVEAIKMGQLQAIKSIHEARQSVEITKPRRKWELKGETVKSEGMTDFGKNMIYLIILIASIIAIIIIWSIVF